MSRTPAFCDGFTLTVPKDGKEDALEAVRGIADTLGCSLVGEGCYKTPEGAILLYGDRGSISWFQAKGKFVTALRARRLLNDYLAAFSTSPHRVSSCDLTVDEFVDSPALRVQGVYSLAKGGGVALSRKALQASQISQVFSPVLYDDTGLDTGTVYLGRRTAEIHGRVYDKTQERASEGECIGLTVRHEMTLSGKMGTSLRDIAEPESCFYHYWPESLLSRPKGVAPWVSVEGGYTLERSERLPAQRLKDRVQFSTDLGDIIRLAQSCGPEGVRMLHRLIDERVAMESRQVGHA